MSWDLVLYDICMIGKLISEVGIIVVLIFFMDGPVNECFQWDAIIPFGSLALASICGYVIFAVCCPAGLSSEQIQMAEGSIVVNIIGFCVGLLYADFLIVIFFFAENLTRIYEELKYPKEPEKAEEHGEELTKLEAAVTDPTQITSEPVKSKPKDQSVQSVPKCRVFVKK